MALKGAGKLKVKIRSQFVTKKEHVQAVIIDGLSRIILDSAVDTGRYRGNWQSSFDERIESETEEIRTPSEVVEEVMAVFGGEIKDGKYYFQNNVVYAEFLEYLSREHAGLVRAELERIRGRLKNDRKA